jgi:hypothetical protein
MPLRVMDVVELRLQVIDEVSSGMLPARAAQSRVVHSRVGRSSITACRIAPVQLARCS